MIVRISPDHGAMPRSVSGTRCASGGGVELHSQLCYQPWRGEAGREGLYLLLPALLQRPLSPLTRTLSSATSSTSAMFQ